jgi:hypothetical protein
MTCPFCDIEFVVHNGTSTNLSTFSLLKETMRSVKPIRFVPHEVDLIFDMDNTRIRMKNSDPSWRMAMLDVEYDKPGVYYYELVVDSLNGNLFFMTGLLERTKFNVRTCIGAPVSTIKLFLTCVEGICSGVPRYPVRICCWHHY